MDRDSLKRHLEFYRDLGIRQLNVPEAPRQTLNAAVAPAPEPVAVRKALPQAAPPPPPPARPPITPPAAATAMPRTPSVSPRSMPAAGLPPAPASAAKTPTSPLIPVTPPDDTLQRISNDIGDCKRCRLCEQRNKIVFGSGNPQARLVFVGEGPGADEDQTGLPFVGRAGQLLTQMIDGTAAKEGFTVRREHMYICNVVKCRPPENRTPLPDEMEICGQFLFRQLLTIQPKAICVLGGTAAKALLGTKDGITKLRGNWQTWRDIQVMPTYHPSFLLRPYSQNAKRESWEDLKKVLHYVFD